jgi:hypothetical protein
VALDGLPDRIRYADESTKNAIAFFLFLLGMFVGICLLAWSSWN